MKGEYLVVSRSIRAWGVAVRAGMLCKGLPARLALSSSKCHAGKPRRPKVDLHHVHRTVAAPLDVKSHCAILIIGGRAK